MKCKYCSNPYHRNHARHDTGELEHLCEYHYSIWHPEMSKFNFKKAKECYICKTKTDKPIKHHISYLPQKIIFVCQTCHKKIHKENIKEYCQFTRRQKLIFYKRKGHLEFRDFKESIRVPMTKEEKKRYHDSSGYKWIYSRPMTDKELWLNKEMKKSKEVIL